MAKEQLEHERTVVKVNRRGHSVASEGELLAFYVSARRSEPKKAGVVDHPRAKG